MGPSLLRRRRCPSPQVAVRVEVRRARALPRRHRAQLRGEPAPLPDLTLAELADLYLKRHAVSVRTKTITTLRERLAYATRAFGDVPLRDLERMSGEIANWQTQLFRTQPIRHHRRIAADARRGRPVGLHERQPSETRRAAKAATAPPHPRLLPGRTRRNRRRAQSFIRLAADIRRRDRAAPRGMERPRAT